MSLNSFQSFRGLSSTLCFQRLVICLKVALVNVEVVLTRLHFVSVQARLHFLFPTLVRKVLALAEYACGVRGSHLHLKLRAVQIPESLLSVVVEEGCKFREVMVADHGFHIQVAGFTV